MFKTVLLPVDLSNPSTAENALKQATEIVQSSSGVLHVLSVVPDFGTAMVAEYFPKNFEKQALQHAEKALEVFRKEKLPTDIEIEVHLAHGSIADSILTKATEVDADLIVMAAHDPDRVRDFLIGSNVERVVRHASVSVLIARH